MWAGAYDRYAASKRKRGTSEVDGEFLKEIESWRDELARNIALRNQFLSPDDLNAAVQRTIDRIIFLRMAEDRGSESYGQLLKLCDQPNMYSRFMSKLCKSADDKYNSGIFHFSKEEGTSESFDALTPKLRVDDKVFKPILQSLYFEHGSPYHFGVLPVEILGTVYERFLGRVIRLTPEHRAKVEDKPEVRKAGGVYYTPSYIVDYIVKNSVGKMIAGKSPAQLAGGKNGQPLRVLDMACGSGSFLLGAFQCLLDHCLKWYMEHQPGKFKNEIFKNRRDEWQMTIAEKKRILTTHIFGVDIDAQAVEVSKLSLLLKAMEGETDETVGKSRQLFHERALPNLSNNIKCGNSLIGPDYFSGRLISDPDEMKRVNPFDWNREFPEAMKAGGFDCVIGNPPYIRIQAMKEWAPLEVEIYKQLFQAASAGNYDIYVVFVEKGLTLLNKNGMLGFILPHKFLNSQYGFPLRSIVAKGKHLSNVVHFSDQQVFDKATTYTCLLFLNKAATDKSIFNKVSDLDAWRISGAGIEGEIDNNNLTSSEWSFTSGKKKELFDRLNEAYTKLGDISFIFVGLQTSADTVFLFKNISKSNKKSAKVFSKELNKEIEIEQDLLKNVIRSGSIGQYWAHPTACVLFPYYLKNGKAFLISESEMKLNFPKAWAYLTENKQLLSNREHGKFKEKGWYQLYPKNLDTWEQPKILLPYMTTKLSAYFDLENMYFVNVSTGGFGVLVDEKNGSSKYFTGLLNSSLLNWFFVNVSTTFHGGYYAANKQYLIQLPVYPIDISNKKELAAHDRISCLVDRMQSLNKQNINEHSESGKIIIQRQIKSTGQEIDQIVYELFDLTEEEIKIIEQATAK